MDALGGHHDTPVEDRQLTAARQILQWTPPRIPGLGTARHVAVAHPALAQPPAGLAGPRFELRLAVPVVDRHAPAPSQSVLPVELPVPWRQPPEPYLLDLPELRATVEPVRRPATDAPKVEPRRLMHKVARVQAMVAILAMFAAPLLTLATGRTSALAFALHGIGAMLMFGVATMAMHQAYPLLRGASRRWASFKTMTSRLAACAVAEGLSGLWLLSYYHADSGPGHALSESAPLVDQLAMNVKLYCGLAAVILCIAAWWSARLASEDRKRSMAIPALATAAAWIAMVCALALGLGIAWIMPA